MKKKILIIGDSCRDVFYYCDANRLAPDLPIPVLNIIDETENPGMARNVLRNVKSIYEHCDIITNDNWYGMTKTRYVHKKTNHTFFRVDSKYSISRINLKNINFNNYDLIAISDYNKGFLSESDIEYISNNHNCVFIDTKKDIGDWINDVKFIKINEDEYNNSKNFIDKNLKDKVIITLGDKGCRFKNERIKTKKVDVKDRTGAGDTFFAALIVEYIKTSDIKKSIRYANKCASEVVKKVAVGVI